MTNEHDSGSKKTPSFGAFIDSSSEGSGSTDNKTSGSSKAGASTTGGTIRKQQADSTAATSDRPPASRSSTRKRSSSRARSSSRPEREEAAGATETAEQPAQDAGGEHASEEAPSRSRRRGSRGGRNRKKTGDAERAAEVEQRSGSDQESAPSEPRAAESRGDEESSEGGTRKKRTRRGRRSKSSDNAEQVEASAEVAEPPRSSDEGEDAPERGGRKKRSRRKRSTRRGKSSEEETQDDSSERAPQAQDDSDSDSGAESAEKKRRRRGTRGGKARGKKTSSRSERPAAAVVEIIPGEEDDLPELPNLPDDAELLDDGEGDKPKRKSRGRRKKSSDREEEEGAELDEEESARASRTKKKDVVVDRQILVNAADREETRVAVVKDQRILDFQMNVESDKSLVNDIYRGRVVNLEESIGAAFIDFGRGRNGFLHTSDVLPAYGEDGWDLSKLLSTRIEADEWDENSSQPHIADELDQGESDSDDDGDDDDDEDGGGKRRGRGGDKKGQGKKGRSQRRRPRPRTPIKKMLKVGDKVVVQVTKDAIGDKGPTLTTYISIPGRYHVLMPSTDHRGVSRKIEDARERRRLKKILDGLDIPEGMGVIARTAAKGCTKVELKRDLDYLLDAWNRLSSKVTGGRGPIALYQESDVAIRTVRDLFGPQTESVIVDEPETYQRVKEFAELLMPEHVDRIKLHDGDRPLFHHAGIEQEFERIFSRRIELPSGGSIVFDQAEALVAIDVNSGKTRTSSHDFEEIALKTNMEAVPEIARQIRLRDLGGILVVDFIDMMKNSNRRNVERAFREQLAMDRARSKLGRISQFGLLEMTRQRLGPGMSKKLFHNCATCRGLGRVRTPVSRAAGILRRLGSAMTLKGFSSVEVRAHADALDYLKREHGEELKALEKQHNRQLQLTAVPDQLEDSVLRYLRTDGREVRPGGRRKR